MKALTIGDIHLADKTPVFRTDDYRETGFSELRMIRDIAIRKKVDLCLFTGDIFHEKSSTKNSHLLVQESIKIFNLFPCPCYSIIGNHDIVYNRLETLMKQPLGVVFESGALKRLDKIKVKDVTIVGVHFREENDYEDLYFKKEKGPLIAVCHVLATPNGGNFFGEKIFSYKKIAKEGKPEVYLFGHLHNYQGIKTIEKKQFINLGAIARGALNQDNINRKVKLGLIEYSEKTFKCSEILLPVIPAPEIFDLERKKDMLQNETEIENFVRTLATNKLFDDLDNLEDNIRTMDVERNIKLKTVQYLNNRGADINI